MEGMILQVVYVDDLRIQLSDGMNTCFLNVGREAATIDALCRKINKAATMKDLVKSIYMFCDFTFVFDWDYDNKRLMVSLDTDEFDFLHPGSIHEKVFRSKDLTSVLGNLERETLKRTAMKKRLPTNTFVGIEMGELIGITSSGGLVMDDELQTGKEAINTVPHIKSTFLSQNMSNLGVKGQTLDQETGSITKSLMKNGWLTFPHLESDQVPSNGDLFDSLEAFVNICKNS